MASIGAEWGFHDSITIGPVGPVGPVGGVGVEYDLDNFFHPYVGKLLEKLNVDGFHALFDAQWQMTTLHADATAFANQYQPTTEALTAVKFFPKQIDTDAEPYANYNWELFFHIPLSIAVHLSKTRRFAEAQRWFHLIFDPTVTGSDPRRFWKFLAFYRDADPQRINELVRILSTPATELTETEKALQQQILQAYQAILNHPFQPHAVARNPVRHVAYQYYVVMKYLDNLIAWGDDLFQQYTVESINEATQQYVLAANILGPRPQQVPSRGTVNAKTFAQLKAAGPDAMRKAIVDLENSLPFNLALRNVAPVRETESAKPLLGLGWTAYFCIGPNDKLLGYWDTVADRLFKIRHCMTIEGVVRPLALFDPPIDPGLLAKAAAAGLPVDSIVSEASQPIGPLRSLPLIQKAMEICAELKNLGGQLLAAFEKDDAEMLALLRQNHEKQLQEMMKATRFLQWKAAQEATRSLVTSRATSLERLRYYKRLLGLDADGNAPDTITLDRRDLDEENFDEAYASLVSQYDKPLTLQAFTSAGPTKQSSPPIASGYSGNGQVYLNKNEDTELNDHMPLARDLRFAGSAVSALAAAFLPVPDAKADFHFWGIGVTADIKVGTALYAAAKTASEVSQILAAWHQDQAGMAARYAGYERRADDWILQHNLAAHEVRQNGRQILSSLIGEQIARHEHATVVTQGIQSQEILTYLQGDKQTTQTMGQVAGKFTTQELYGWMQGECSDLYYKYYRFAVDIARKAERAMKQELMRPEVYAQDFISFNYWDTGRKGLLAGEKLQCDLKQMEMAYHDNNKRELELTRHVSLRQLNPFALLQLKISGSCQVTIPEWLYDRDCPGHYMRRIKTVGVSVPSVVGPYTSLNLTLTLLQSHIRRLPVLKDGSYPRQGTEDDRFIDYTVTESVVTSAGSNDSGMFETNLRDERFLPFEGAGAESTWKLDLPQSYKAFDYATISDVILHVRYTARQGVDPGKVTEALNELFKQTTDAPLALFFSLRHDFPTEWSAFVNGNGNMEFTLRKNYFPYFVQDKKFSSIALDLYASPTTKVSPVSPADLQNIVKDLNSTKASSDLSLPPDANVLKRDAKDVFVIITYKL